MAKRNLTARYTLDTDAGPKLVERTIVVDVPPKFTAKVKRGLVLLWSGRADTAAERSDVEAARAWIAYGAEHLRWGTTTRHTRKPVAPHPLWRDRDLS